jgi:hypothetical protein
MLIVWEVTSAPGKQAVKLFPLFPAGWQMMIKGKMIRAAGDYLKTHQFGDNDTVCFCFLHTKEDIEQDFIKHGYSKILEKIKTAKSRGGCSCQTENPTGR